MNNTVVIGGGAAGCIAAVFSARNGDRVKILEPNGRIGKKLAITGKGRCNITNRCDLDGLMKNIYRGNKFLYSALSRFGAGESMAFFEGLGVPLKVERGNRVFPVSDKAYDIVAALEKELSRLKAEIIPQKAVKILTENGRVTGVKTNREVFAADKVILATGGLSYPATGSTGEGYKLAKALGHTVTPLTPSLVPMETEEDCSPMAGLTVKNCVLTVTDLRKNKNIFSQLGEIAFEAYGIGGALTLSASALIDSVEKGRYRANVDFKPALDEKKLDLRIQRDIAAYSKENGAEIVRKLLPEKLVKPVLEMAKISGEKKAAEISKAERMSLVNTLKGFTLTLKAFRPIKEAVITDGGISLKEINPKDMQSKLVEGLYFAGEIMDVSGYTGGFNLQIAFATGAAAGGAGM